MKYYKKKRLDKYNKICIYKPSDDFIGQQNPNYYMANKKKGNAPIQGLSKEVKSLNKRAKKARKSDGVINVEVAQDALDAAATALGKRRKKLNKRKMADK